METVARDGRVFDVILELEPNRHLGRRMEGESPAKILSISAAVGINVKP